MALHREVARFLRYRTEFFARFGPMTFIMKMPKPIDAPRKLTLRDSKPVLLRAGTGLAIAVGFLWVTSQVDPQPSSAVSNASRSQNMVDAPAAHHGARAQNPAPPRGLGSLEGKKFSVHLVASSDEPLYTVIDHHGDVVASGLTKTQMYVQFPELRLETLTATPLMMAPENYRD